MSPRERAFSEPPPNGQGEPRDHKLIDLSSSWTDREDLASETGRWVRKAIASNLGFNQPIDITEPLNPRVYLHGENRVFIAFTDSDGSKLDPAVVSLKKRPLEELTNSADTRKGSLHPLIIGWPSQREAKKCVTAAECSWPKEILKQ